MRKAIFIIIIIALCLQSCRDSKTRNDIPATTESEEKQREEKSPQSHGYNELANEDKKEIYPVSDYNTDNPSIPTIDRPGKSSIKNFRYPKENLFGVWTNDPEAPHATFQLDKKEFYVVDYDGNGSMPYQIHEDSIIVYYNDFIQRGKVDAGNKDTLKIQWEESERATEYYRWKN